MFNEKRNLLVIMIFETIVNEIYLWAWKWLTPYGLEIIKLANQQSIVGVEELAEYFNVSLQTIRKDLNKLCSDGRSKGSAEQ